MTDRDRFERNRAQEHDWNSDFYNDDRSLAPRSPSWRGRSGYYNEDSSSHAGRGYSRLGGAGEEEHERYGYGPQRREPYGQRDWGQRDLSQQRDSGYDQRGSSGGGRNQFPYMGSAYPSQRSFDEGRQGSWYGYGQPSQQGQYEQRGRFAGKGPKGYKRSDERILEEVSDALMMHPDIDASDIEVTVSDGEVTLTGTVQEREDKYLAEHLCEGIAGVRDVNSSLRVKRLSEREGGSSSNDSAQRNGRSGTQGGGNVSQGGGSSRA